MMGRSVYHDRDDEVVVVIDEEGGLVRRIDAEDARVIVNEYTEDFLVAHTPGVGEKTTVKVFDRSGGLKLDIEVNLGPGPKERIVGTLDNAVITRPFAFGVTATEYKVFHYSQEGKRVLIEESDKRMSEVWTYAPDIIWISEDMLLGGPRNAVSKYDSAGRLLYEYQYPETARFRGCFFSPDGRHLLTNYQPEDERHRRNFTLHIEGRGPVEWKGRRPFGRRPHHPVLFRDDEEMLFYRDTQGIKAYDYDGNRIWTAHLPNRHSTHSLAAHRVGDRSVLTSYEVRDGVPRIAHYSLQNGFRLGVTDLGEHVDEDEDTLERVPGRFFADGEGNLLLPIGEKYVAIGFNRKNQ